jgi:phosphatidylserine decarboxylase
MNILLQGIIIVFGLFVIYFLFWKLFFLRDPRRKIPVGDNIVSPADGIILEVLNLEDVKKITIYKKYIGKIKTICNDVSTKAVVVSIFMSPMNVHINRVPMGGQVVSVKHEVGKFLAVNTLKAGLENEKSEVLLKTNIGNIKFIQVAGLLARSIENRLVTGQKVKKGERYGLINLGSQLILILPYDKVNLKVKKGDKVRAGESVIANIKE